MTCCNKLRLLVSFVTAMLVSTESLLKQIHVVTRHGSRLHLSKNAQTLSEGGPGELTPLGQKQHFELGVWLAETYKGLDIVDVFTSSKVRLESSSFDRTIVSANSLALGLFGRTARDPNGFSLLPATVTPANVPVYTTDAVNDITIHGYDKCQAGLNLDELYRSGPWKDLESAHASLLHNLSSIAAFGEYVDPSSGIIPLDQVWNVLDMVKVAKTECSYNSSVCTSEMVALQNILSDTDWTELQAVAYDAELMKYSTQQVGTLVGGNLLAQILSRMNNGTQQFYLYSAHYPTILGLFAALGLPPVDSEVIPGYGTALVFELFQDADSGAQSVNLFYKPGGGESPENVPLASMCSSESCSLETLLQNLESRYSLAEWCRVCENDSASPCLPSLYTEEVVCRTTIAGPVVAGIFGGFGFACLLGATIYLYYRQKHLGEKPSNEVLGEKPSNEVPASTSYA